MLFVSRPLCVRSLALCLAVSLAALVAAPVAQAQSSSTNTALDKQLSRLDLGLNATYSHTFTVSGTNAVGPPGSSFNVPVTQKVSNTTGALLQFRYTRSPWVGGEFNISYARNTHNFTTTSVCTDPTECPFPLGVQTNALSFMLGYIVHPPHQIAGLQPFLGGGMGLMYFHTTSGGGQGLQKQGVGGAYYTVGVEKEIVPHLGVRGQFRQLFYLAPDFYLPFLTIQKQTSTMEPAIGIYLHY